MSSVTVNSGATLAPHFGEGDPTQFYTQCRSLGQMYGIVPTGSFITPQRVYQKGERVYFQDPSGHLLEIITRPYGSGG